MPAKKILLVNPGPIIPVLMGSQERVKNYLITLSRDHKIDFCYLSKNQEDVDLASYQLDKYCNRIIPIRAINRTFMQRIVLKLSYFLCHLIFGSSKRYFYWGGQSIINQIVEIITSNNYDIVQIEHPYQAAVFKVISGPKKILSLHDVYHQKKQLEIKNDRSKLSFWKMRELNKYANALEDAVDNSDVLITISLSDNQYYKKEYPDKEILLIPMGIQPYDLRTGMLPGEKQFVLFYGNLSSPQNQVAVKRLVEEIFPLIKNEIPLLKLLIVGASPTQEILGYHNDKDIIVKGFVKDLNEIMSECLTAVIPLELGSGFRGRVVEIMSFGVPVIGTHNALDCIGMINGTHGFITDDNQLMADYTVKLARKNELRTNIAESCIEFVRTNYTFESTYFRLSKYYESI